MLLTIFLKGFPSRALIGGRMMLFCLVAGGLTGGTSMFSQCLTMLVSALYYTEGSPYTSKAN